MMHWIAHLPWIDAILEKRQQQRLTSRAVERLMQPRPINRELDVWLLWSAMGLLMLGLVMVYSASIAIAEGSRNFGHQPDYFLVRHSISLVVGAVGALIVFRFSMRELSNLAPWFFLGSVILVGLVLVPGIGREVNGAQRWLPLGSFSLQPSELLKVCTVLYSADYTVRKLRHMGDFLRGFLPMAGVILLVGCLLLLEPDFGGFVVICCIAFGVMFLGGMNIRLFLLLIVVAVLGFAALILGSPYRRDRLFGFMDPWKDAFDSGYQLSHALIAFGRGEWLGVGLGGSVEKLFYLPEAHTDFLLAVIAEELGFLGVAVIVVLFGILIQRAFTIGKKAVALEQHFSGLVAMGIGLWFGVQAIVSMGVNMGLLPTKGLTLPFMSYGGSAIIANCLAVAILLRIDWESRQLQWGGSI